MSRLVSLTLVLLLVGFACDIAAADEKKGTQAKAKTYTMKVTVKGMT